MIARPIGPARLLLYGLLAAFAALGLNQPTLASGPLAHASAAASSTVPFTITSSAMHVTGFHYAGIVTMPSTGGQALVLEFTATTATLSDLHILLPCTGGHRLEMNVGTGTAGLAAHGLSLDVASFHATVNGTAITYTPSSPPVSSLLSSGSGTLSSVTLVAMAISAPQLSLAQATTRTATCTQPAAHPQWSPSPKSTLRPAPTAPATTPASPTPSPSLGPSSQTPAPTASPATP